MSPPKTLLVSLPDLAGMIDHSLLHPTMTDDEVLAGLEICKKYGVATACIKPYHIPLAKKVLQGSDVLICPVIGFPHGNSTTEVKVFEATRAAEEGGNEIDMVVNIGKVLSREWDYVENEIRLINEAVISRGAILKVIFENDYLTSPLIIHLTSLCANLSPPPAFIKTSTGYGFTKTASGLYTYAGATLPHLHLMKTHSAGSGIKIKAAGGIRTLDDLLRVRAIGVERVGATATEGMLEEARKRGIVGEEKVEVMVNWEGFGGEGKKGEMIGGGDEVEGEDRLWWG